MATNAARVLIVERDLGLGADALARLERAGHDVIECVSPGEAPMHCKGQPGQSGCPLDELPADVVLAVRGDAGGTGTDREGGVRCAMRKSIPVMVVGSTLGAGYGPSVDAVVDMQDAALAELVSDLARRGHQEVARRVCLVAHEVLSNCGEPDVGATATVRREADRLLIGITVDRDIDPRLAQLVAAKAFGAIAGIRPGFDKVDVGVSTPGD